MPMIDFQPQPLAAKQFVEVWSDRYYYDRSVEEPYEKNIGQELTEERVFQLFRWKNGYSRFSKNKEATIRRNFLKTPEELLLSIASEFGVSAISRVEDFDSPELVAEVKAAERKASASVQGVPQISFSGRVLASGAQHEELSITTE